METIVRDDGRLVVGAYRDTVFAGNRNQARQEVGLVAENHGAYMHIAKSADGWRVATSNEPGYLLGELLHASLRLPNLVYVERLDDDKCILIVVSDGLVKEDSVVHLGNVPELAATIFLENKMDVRVSGDVPLRRFGTDHDQFDGYYSPPPNLVQSWEKLPDRYSLQVPLARSAQLQDWRKARNSALGVSLATPLLVVVLGIIGVVAYRGFQDEPARPATPPDPLAGAASRWQGGSPLTVALAETARLVADAHRLPGWVSTKVERDVGGYTVTLEPAHPAASASLLYASYGGRVNPQADSRVFKATIPAEASSRSRPAFEQALRASPDRSAIEFVDLIGRGGWGIVVVPSSAESGMGYRGHRLKLTGQALTPVHLAAAARGMAGRFPSAAVEHLEYTPLDGRFVADVILYTR